MKNNFDKKIKDLLDEASISDTGLSFNKNALWDRIHHTEKKVVLPFKSWISHAAAVIIGVLLCLPFLFISHKTNEPKQIEQVVVHEAAKVVRDTVYMTAPQSIAVVDKQNNSHIIITKDYNPTTYPKPTPEFKEEPQINNPVHNQKTYVINTTKTPPAVLYLSDIKNENTTTKYRIKNGFPILNSLNGNDSKNENSESISVLLANNFSHQKSNSK